ncbi:MAG: Gfo/Idh/MocA family oxidoreductase [Fimbriimonadaceae bacterium]|nr:Gfo/Idh/MocA family oxidoreductase [Fimbriimonadaceae bacterium]
MPAPVRVGILSTANIGGRLITALANSPAAELVAISSRDAARLPAYVEKFKIGAGVRQHGSYEALLADPAVEAVYNPLPNSLHAEWTSAAAQAGKHILCEKPLARDVAECRAMLAAAETAGVVLMEAFMYRHHPATRRLREVIAAGAIGAVRVVRAGFCFTVNDPTNIRLRGDVAGGSAMDVGCYCINFARLVTGEEPQTAYAVATFGTTNGIDETLVGTLSFPSGAVAQFESSVQSAGRAFGNVLGSQGTLAVERPWFPHPERAVFQLNGQEVVVEGGGDPYQNELEVFCESLREGTPLPLPPVDGARNMAALVALLQSARSGQPVPVEVV